MAKQIITMLTDDLDGGAADETVTFAYDGISYEIDLSQANADKLRDLLNRYVQGGTRLGRTAVQSPVFSRQRGAVSAEKSQTKQLNTSIRLWAAENGYILSERGRIPQHVVSAYRKNIPAAPAPSAAPSEPEVKPARKSKAVPPATFSAPKTPRSRSKASA